MNNNFLLTLLTLSTTALWGNASAANANAAADVKTSHAEATEADQKATQNSALPYFEQWVRKNLCPEDCLLKVLFQSLGRPCHQHCNESCFAQIRNNKPCTHMVDLAISAFKTNGSYPKFANIAHDTTSTTDTIVPPPQETTARLVADLPMMLPDLAQIIASYTSEGATILVTIMDHANHPITKGRTRHTCSYNLDTKQLVVLKTEYEYYNYNQHGPFLGIEWCDTPKAPHKHHNQSVIMGTTCVPMFALDKSHA